MSRLLWALALPLALVLAWQLYRAMRAYRLEVLSLHPPRGRVVAPPDSAALGLIDVSLTSRDKSSMKGWYVPSKNGAAIVIVHGSGSDRSSLLQELRLFANTGFGVLAFDLPGHGESDGVVRFGAQQSDAVAGAVDFVANRPDVHDARIGVAGFSWGGSSVARAAAADCRMRAVAIIATPADGYSQTLAEYARYGRAAQIGAFAVYWFRGIDLREQRPMDFAARISPRPVLIVGSPDDESVPPSQTEQFFAAAREPKQLYMTHGPHMEFANADPKYLPTLLQFFESTLRDPQTVTDCPK